MANNDQELEFSLSLDTNELKRGLTEAEALMAQGVERMNAIGSGQQTTIQPPIVGTSLPNTQPSSPGTIPPTPLPPTPPAPASSPQPAISSAWEELEKIKQLAKTSPDVALAGLVGMGGGGLHSRAVRGAMADPGSAEEYQQLLGAIKDLNRSIREGIKAGEKQGSDPASGLLGFIRSNQMIGAAGMVGSNLMSGNMLGAGGSAIGGLAGFMFGGPAGAMAGSAIGGMVGSGAGSFLSGADEAREYSKLTADIAARFGDFDQEDGLKLEQINKVATAGYSSQETAQLVDALRQNHVIDSVDSSSMELVQSIQELTRATGINTEAIVQDYSNYKRSGGRDDADQYMSMMIAGAVGAGMRSHLQEYGEMVGSARMNLVARTGQADIGDGALKTIQGTLANLLGGNSNTAQLLRDNPMLANQTLNGFLATGGAQQYSLDSAQLQMAGVTRGRTDTTYLTPQLMVENAARRSMFAFNQFLPSAGQVLGLSEDQIRESVKADPNFLQNKISGSNPNPEEAAALQDILNMNFHGVYGRNPNKDEFNLLTQLGSSALANNGVLDLSAPGVDGKTLTDLIAESQKTEGQKARDAQAKRHEEIKQFMNNFKGLLTTIDSSTADLMKNVNLAVGFLKPIAEGISKFTGQQTNAQGVALNPVQAIGEKLQDSDNGVFSLFGKGVLSTEKAVNPAFKSISDYLKIGVSAGSPITGAIVDQIGAGASNALTKIIMGDQKQNKNIPPDRPAHLKLDDTPPDGILSQPGFDTFQFAHGDRVFASPSATSGDGNVNISPTININLQVPSDKGYEWVRDAARSGVQSGQDEFLRQIEDGVLDRRNSPRIRGRSH